MNRLFSLIVTGAVVLLTAALVPHHAAGQVSDAGEQAVEEDDYSILTRGPLHEAFAEPYNDQLDQGLVVATRPPNPIDEIPPEYRPEGKNVQWIPGYWGLDDENQFIWISGVWRDVPPGTRWVPGYWTEVEGGFRWVPGFWTKEDADEITYLPTPPDTLEQGPSSPAPSENYFWVPGCWIWRASNYAWRPGYWWGVRPGWIWYPGRYFWTPRGYIFRRGFWDYLLGYRGLAFAPVLYHRPVYLRPGFYFTPRIVLGTADLLAHLFLRPRYGHYYFGNYYADPFRRAGFYPFATIARYRHYDPLYSYLGARYRRSYIDDLVRRHDYYARNPDLRPPNRYRDFGDWRRRYGGRDITAALVRPLDAVVRGDGDRRYRSVAQNQRQELARRNESFRQLSLTRGEQEIVRRDRSADRSQQVAGGSWRLPDAARRPQTARPSPSINRDNLGRNDRSVLDQNARLDDFRQRSIQERSQRLGNQSSRGFTRPDARSSATLPSGSNRTNGVRPQFRGFDTTRANSGQPSTQRQDARREPYRRDVGSPDGSRRITAARPEVRQPSVNRQSLSRQSFNAPSRTTGQSFNRQNFNRQSTTPRPNVRSPNVRRPTVGSNSGTRSFSRPQLRGVEPSRSSAGRSSFRGQSPGRSPGATRSFGGRGGGSGLRRSR